jgi:hypothetical protein
MSFVCNVLASVVGSLLVIWLAGIVSSKARWIFTAAVARWLDVDVEFVFRNQAAAATDLQNELESATDICVLTGRGSELQRETFSSLFMPGASRVSVRILLPDTEPPDGSYNWTDQRENEVAAFDDTFGGGLLARQIDTSVTFVRQQVKAGRAQLRLFNAPHVGRFVITERYAYFTPYRTDVHSRDSRVYKFRRGDMYDNFKRHFEQLWQAAEHQDPAT